MKFYRLNELPPRTEGPVFKASSMGALVMFIISFGIAIGLLVYGITGSKIDGQNRPPSVFIYFVAAFALMFAAFAWGQFRAAIRPTNWLLRCQNNGVIIKYRSFENWRFPVEDVQTVGLDYSEIAEVKIIKDRRITPSLGENRGKQYQALTFLSFRLANPDTSALEARLQTEQKAEPPGNFKTIYRDYPVEVQPGGIIQVRWTGIHPSARKAIQHLGRFVKVAAPDSTKTDLTYRPNLTPAEGDANILKLAQSGNKMGAIALTRQIYGSTLTEAVAYVDKLQSGT